MVFISRPISHLRERKNEQIIYVESIGFISFSPLGTMPIFFYVVRMLISMLKSNEIGFCVLINVLMY